MIISDRQIAKMLKEALQMCSNMNMHNLHIPVSRHLSWSMTAYVNAETRYGSVHPVCVLNRCIGNESVPKIIT